MTCQFDRNLLDGGLHHGAARDCHRRLLDVLLGSILFLFCLPAILGVALALLLQDGCHPLMVTKTLGKGARRFGRLRFRITCAGLQRESPPYRLGDPRLTRVGAWLYRASLHGLPELISVLRGDMSLVGPRPHGPEEAAYLTAHLPGYAERHLLRPGFVNPTLWCAPDASEMARLRCDILYVRRAGPGTDLWLLAFSVRQRLRALSAAVGLRPQGTR